MPYLVPVPQHGANVNAQMSSGNSALHSASGRGLLPLVRTLVRSGADSSLKNCHNDTPLMVARNRRVSVRAAGCGGGAPGDLTGPWHVCARVCASVPGVSAEMWGGTQEGKLRHADRKGFFPPSHL